MFLITFLNSFSLLQVLPAERWDKKKEDGALQQIAAVYCKQEIESLY